MDCERSHYVIVESITKERTAGIVLFVDFSDWRDVVEIRKGDTGIMTVQVQFSAYENEGYKGRPLRVRSDIGGMSHSPNLGFRYKEDFSPSQWFNLVFDD